MVCVTLKDYHSESLKGGLKNKQVKVRFRATAILSTWILLDNQ